MDDYPLAWNLSYKSKGQQWRGLFQYSKFEKDLELGGKVLELGSGDGNSASQILKLSEKIICLDIAVSSFRTLPMKELAMPKIVGDARMLPLKAGGFSTVICRHVLTHVRHDDSLLILKEVRRILAKNGTALIEVFTPDDMRYGKGKMIEPDTFLRQENLIWRFYTMGELKDLVEKAGLKIKKEDILAREVRHDGVEYQRESLVVIAGPGLQ